MALTIKDGAGATTALNTSLAGGEHTPYHAISGTVNVTASQASPVHVTGTVTVGANSVVPVTASHLDPVAVSINSLPIDLYHYTGDIYGAVVSRITQSASEALAVTASKNQPIFVISDSDKPVVVANSTNIPLFVTSSEGYPVVTKNAVATSIGRSTFSTFANTIDWAGTGSSNISGTFILAQSSSTRKGLMFANTTNKDLYVALGDTDLAATNGFLLSTTASAPSYYSFILYPSGTYFAEPAFVSMKHSGFFISSSNIQITISSVGTE